MYVNTTEVDRDSISSIMKISKKKKKKEPKNIIRRRVQLETLQVLITLL